MGQSLVCWEVREFFWIKIPDYPYFKLPIHGVYLRMCCGYNDFCLLYVIFTSPVILRNVDLGEKLHPFNPLKV